MADTRWHYVSLGDSMSIDDYAGGLGCGAPALLTRNRDADFPEWQGRDLKTCLPGAQLLPMAMDGATSASVRFVQLPRLKEMGVKPRLVTLTMGGNDLLQSFGDESAAKAACHAFRENGGAALAGIRAYAGAETPILMGTVYDPSDGTGDTVSLQIMPWPGALAWISRMNETIRELAREHGATLIDTHAAFQGHGLKAGNPAQNDPRPPGRALYYCGVVEPNAWGASALRGLWWDALRTCGFVKAANS